MAKVELRLNNNTPWAIKFCSFSVKNQYGDTGIVYEVKRSRTFGLLKGSSNQSELPEERNKEESIKTPHGYSTGDVCITYSLDSGKSVPFSLPREHLGKNLYIEFEYWPEWENRDNELGNFPQYYVSFGNQELPSSER